VRQGGAYTATFLAPTGRRQLKLASSKHPSSCWRICVHMSHEQVFLFWLSRKSVTKWHVRRRGYSPILWASSIDPSIGKPLESQLNVGLNIASLILLTCWTVLSYSIYLRVLRRTRNAQRCSSPCIGPPTPLPRLPMYVLAVRVHGCWW